MAQPDDVLDGDRLVETELGAQRGNALRIAGAAGAELLLRGVARRQADHDEDERRGQQDHRDQLQQPADDDGSHASGTLTFRTSARRRSCPHLQLWIEEMSVGLPSDAVNEMSVNHSASATAKGHNAHAAGSRAPIARRSRRVCDDRYVGLWPHSAAGASG